MASLRTSLVAVSAHALRTRLAGGGGGGCGAGRMLSTRETAAPKDEGVKRQHAEETKKGSRAESTADVASSIPFLDDSCAPSYICDPGASHKTDIACAKECEAPVPDEEEVNCLDGRPATA